VLTRIRWGGK